MDRTNRFQVSGVRFQSADKGMRTVQPPFVDVPPDT